VCVREQIIATYKEPSDLRTSLVASLGRVCLFPAGMSAIFACHDCGRLLRRHHFRAIQSRGPNEIGATVPTPLIDQEAQAPFDVLTGE
jgi:hypothetical protein